MHSRLRTGFAVAFCAITASLATAAAAPASVQLFPSASPLPGSSFQAADGNQTPANGTTKLDWKDFKNDPELKTIVDPSDPDKEFGGGSSEDKPDTWTFNYPAESTPSKANFRVAWDLFKSDPGRLLQLAFRRAEKGGNAFLAFELNQDPRMWANSVGATIPCRNTGDLLITYNVANSDATQIYLTVQKWTSATSDPATGCARTGTLDELPSTALLDGVNVQGAVNNALSNALSPELPAPPAGLPNNEDGAIPSEMESGLSCGAADNWICGGLFGEAAIDLPSVFDKYQSSPCFSFGSVWAHGRSSISENSALQDYVEPTPLAVRSCTASGFKFNDLNANGEWDKPDEPAVEGWKVWLDKNKDGKVDDGEVQKTNSLGEYVFTDLATGTYSVKELPASEQEGDLKKLDTCSYPVADCADGHSVTIDKENLTSIGNNFGNYANPRLELVKSLKPSDDPGVFDLTAEQTSGGSGSISSTDSGDGEGTGEKTVSPGAWKLSEAAGTDTVMADYGQELGCLERGTTTEVGVTEGEISLSVGDDVVCTFTNTRKTGTIKLVKQLSPASDPGLFNLQLDGSTKAANVGNGGASDTLTVNTGGYTVSEVAGTGTSLADYTSSASCESNGQVIASGAVTSLSVSVASEQAVTCTFTNTRNAVPPPPQPPGPTPEPGPGPGPANGTVTVVKNTTDGSPGTFGFGGDLGSFSLASGASTSFSLPAGTYSVTETQASGYTLSSLVCSDAGDAAGSSSVAGSSAAINLQAGETVVCTWTNAPAGGVLPAIAGSARISGSQGCVTGRYAYVRVRGANIDRVTFRVGGRSVKTLTERNSRGRYFELRYPVRKIRQGKGLTVRARVLYTDGASPQTASLRWRLIRCAQRVSPEFTG